MTERLCAKCHFPIHRDDTVRHYGFYEAHLESRCLELLRAEVTRLREENAGVRERNDRVVAIEGSGIPWRDVDDNYDYAASAVRAKIARADAEHAAALAAERERVVGECAKAAGTAIRAQVIPLGFVLHPTEGPAAFARVAEAAIRALTPAPGAAAPHTEAP